MRHKKVPIYHWNNIPYVFVFAGDTALELIDGKFADESIQISNYMAESCRKYGYYPEIVPKGLDSERFNLSIDEKELRSKFNFSEENFFILTVCRLDPRKNLETLLRSADILIHKRNKQKVIQNQNNFYRTT